MNWMFILAAEAEANGSSFSHWLGGFFVPIVIIMLAIAFIIVVKVMASRYKKIAPNEVGIFYGRSYRHTDKEGRAHKRGFRVVSGGGALLWPIVENLQLMSTAVTQVEIDEHEIPNKDNVKISAKGIATFKIDTTDEALHNAAAAFLGKEDEEVARIVKNILQGHLRSIIGKLDINEILRDRDAFNKKVVDESSEELKRLSILIVNLVIQEVTDEYGYIVALGRKAVSETVRDANIKVAEAEAETTRKVSDAQREASITVASNAVRVAEAEKDRDVQKAEFMATSLRAQAIAENAGAIADAEQKRILVVKIAERDASEKEAQVKVQEKEGQRIEQQLVATQIRPAEAAQRKAVIDAEAQRKKAVIEAEAQKQVAIVQAEGTKARAVTTAEGAKEAAVLEGEGQASKIKAVMFAEAQGEAAKKKQILVAQAEGEAAQKGLVLTAEAEGTAKLAEALAKMTTDAKLIIVLDRLPALFDKGGDAASKVASAIFSSVAAPFGSIDKISIVDMFVCGKSLQGFGNIVPDTVFKFIAGLQARGVDVKKIAEKAGVNIDGIMEMLGKEPATNAVADVQAAPAAPVAKDQPKK